MKIHFTNYTSAKKGGYEQIKRMLNIISSTSSNNKYTIKRNREE